MEGDFSNDVVEVTNLTKEEQLQTAVFGNGCYWCTEAVYQRVKGVKEVTSGFSGGFIDNPTYEEVKSELTGHAECCFIQFDPEEVSYEDLLEVFFFLHDPTVRNKKNKEDGNYRSVIFYTCGEQKETATRVVKEFGKMSLFKQIATEVVPFKKFFKTHASHQNYYNKMREENVYCDKIEKESLRKLNYLFAEKVKV